MPPTIGVIHALTCCAALLESTNVYHHASIIIAGSPTMDDDAKPLLRRLPIEPGSSKNPPSGGWKWNASTNQHRRDWLVGSSLTVFHQVNRNKMRMMTLYSSRHATIQDSMILGCIQREKILEIFKKKKNIIWSRGTAGIGVHHSVGCQKFEDFWLPRKCRLWEEQEDPQETQVMIHVKRVLLLRWQQQQQQQR